MPARSPERGHWDWDRRGYSDRYYDDRRSPPPPPGRRPLSPMYRRGSPPRTKRRFDSIDSRDEPGEIRQRHTMSPEPIDKAAELEALDRFLRLLFSCITSLSRQTSASNHIERLLEFTSDPTSPSVIEARRQLAEAQDEGKVKREELWEGSTALFRRRRGRLELPDVARVEGTKLSEELLVKVKSLEALVLGFDERFNEMENWAYKSGGKEDKPITTWEELEQQRDPSGVLRGAPVEEWAEFENARDPDGLLRGIPKAQPADRRVEELLATQNLLAQKLEEQASLNTVLRAKVKSASEAIKAANDEREKQRVGDKQQLEDALAGMIVMIKDECKAQTKNAIAEAIATIRQNKPAPRQKPPASTALNLVQTEQIRIVPPFRTALMPKPSAPSLPDRPAHLPDRPPAANTPGQTFRPSTPEISPPPPPPPSPPTSAAPPPPPINSPAPFSRARPPHQDPAPLAVRTIARPIPTEPATFRPPPLGKSTVPSAPRTTSPLERPPSAPQTIAPAPQSIGQQPTAHAAPLEKPSVAPVSAPLGLPPSLLVKPPSAMQAPLKQTPVAGLAHSTAIPPSQASVKQTPITQPAPSSQSMTTAPAPPSSASKQTPVVGLSQSTITAPTPSSQAPVKQTPNIPPTPGPQSSAVSPAPPSQAQIKQTPAAGLSQPTTKAPAPPQGPVKQTPNIPTAPGPQSTTTFPSQAAVKQTSAVGPPKSMTTAPAPPFQLPAKQTPAIRPPSHFTNTAPATAGLLVTRAPSRPTSPVPPISNRPISPIPNQTSRAALAQPCPNDLAHLIAIHTHITSRIQTGSTIEEAKESLPSRAKLSLKQLSVSYRRMVLTDPPSKWVWNGPGGAPKLAPAPASYTPPLTPIPTPPPAKEPATVNNVEQTPSQPLETPSLAGRITSGGKGPLSIRISPGALERQPSLASRMNTSDQPSAPSEVAEHSDGLQSRLEPTGQDHNGDIQMADPASTPAMSSTTQPEATSFTGRGSSLGARLGNAFTFGFGQSKSKD